MICLVAVLAITYATKSLSAEPTRSLTCCADNDDCSATGTRCCDPVLLGLDDCHPARTGYCQVLCIPPDGIAP
jgi:hypothetical protein